LPRLHSGIGYVFARLAPTDSAGGDHRGAEGTVGTSDGTPVIQRAPDAVELAISSYVPTCSTFMMTSRSARINAYADVPIQEAGDEDVLGLVSGSRIPS
jgi:hypothetical protein